MFSLHVVGDSISQQYGPYLQRYLAGWAEYSRKEYDPLEPDDPNAANGGDSARVLRYLRWRQSQECKWDCLLFNCGLHDLKTDPVTQARQVPLETYEHNLPQIIAVGRTLAPRLVWARTTPVVDAIHNAIQKEFHRHAADVDRYNAAADRIMAEHGVPVIDLFRFTRNLGQDVYVDHVHFAESVRQLHAACIAGCLMTALG